MLTAVNYIFCEDSKKKGTISLFSASSQKIAKWSLYFLCRFMENKGTILLLSVILKVVSFFYAHKRPYVWVRVKFMVRVRSSVSYFMKK